MAERIQIPLLLETIRSEDGILSNLPYHQKRCDLSRQTLFCATDTLDLQTLLNPPKQGLYRCRVIYAKQLQSIEYIPYTPKEIHSLKVVPSSIEYTFKYANRKNLDELLALHSDVDEIIIEKNGYLTDTTISNIAFYDGQEWFTPASPLLKGTMRQKLLDEHFLKTRDIRKVEIKNYKQVALMNAMIGFKILNHFNIE